MNNFDENFPKMNQLTTVFYNHTTLMLELTFEDGLKTELPIEKLEMPIRAILWETARITEAGLTFTDYKGNLIPIGSDVVRYFVDPVYAAAIDRESDAIRLTHEELEELAKDSKPPDWWYGSSSENMELWDKEVWENDTIICRTVGKKKE